MVWVAKDYIGEWIFNCKPDLWAGDCIEHNYSSLSFTGSSLQDNSLPMSFLMLPCGS